MAQAGWKAFEKKCVKYLNKVYRSPKRCTFTLKGGSDSTASDIVVKTESGKTFNIEAKMPAAQSGQFVLFPNDCERLFEYSEHNKSPKTPMADKIIESMNADYQKYCKPTTKGIDLEIPESAMFDWVKDYYSRVKKTRYFITQYNDQYVVMPVSKIDQYFEISGKYRIKRSGSCHPAKKNIQEIEQMLKENGMEYEQFTFKNKGCSIVIKGGENTFTLSGAFYRYKFDKNGGDTYHIRRLSNTAHANVIFSLTAKSPQQKADLEQFEKDLL